MWTGCRTDIFRISEWHQEGHSVCPQHDTHIWSQVFSSVFPLGWSHQNPPEAGQQGRCHSQLTYSQALFLAPVPSPLSLSPCLDPRDSLSSNSHYQLSLTPGTGCASRLICTLPHLPMCLLHCPRLPQSRQILYLLSSSPSQHHARHKMKRTSSALKCPLPLRPEHHLSRTAGMSPKRKKAGFTAGNPQLPARHTLSTSRLSHDARDCLPQKVVKSK